MKKVLIIGAGWAGASCSNYLEENLIETTLIEQKNVVGGHSRSEVKSGVIYEPNGPHIFHTSNEEVNNFVRKFGMKRKFKHKVKSRIYPPSLKGDSALVSWPPQVNEIKKFQEWINIEKELMNLPKKPNDNNFETYAISIMGKTLYELFIYGYTKKQWDLEPNELSSRFAPKRIDLRTDNELGLFKDKWEYFHAKGSGDIIENILINKDVHFDLKVDINNISNLIKDYTHVVITSALDDFIASDQKLEWRGIKSKTKLYEDLDESECITEAYQINHPSLEENYTRTIETKHASGQRVKASIVQEEYAYPNIRHYPVYRSGTNVFDDNDKFKNQIINEISRPVYFAGRLANYKYINQDEAILDGFRAARKILKA